MYVGLVTSFERHELTCILHSCLRTQTAHDHNIGTVAAESDGEEDEDCDEYYQLNQQSHVPVDHAPVRTACANTAHQVATHRHVPVGAFP